jgi:ketosteroid isomerase-like protein
VQLRGIQIVEYLKAGTLFAERGFFMRAICVFTILLFTCLAAHADQESTLEIVNKFYSAFQAGDAVTMGQQYADTDTPVFSDEIFIGLSSEEARKMWTLLLQGRQKPVVKFEVVVAGDDHAVVRWTADFIFSKTGRTVHNEVTSLLFIRDGKIIRQDDKFDLCMWTRQAYGLIGGTSLCTFPDQTIRKQARTSLEAVKN